MSVNNVTAVSVSYEPMRKDWNIITDVLAGTRRMRAKGERYLPKEPKEDTATYQRRIERSFLFNMFKAALRSIVSQAFSKRAKVVEPEALPEEIRMLPKNMNGTGLDINSYASELFESVTGLGHAFIFVDFTNVKSKVGDRQISKQEEKELGLRPIFKIIRAPDMLDWRYETINGVKRLSWIKFREVRIERVDEWKTEEVEYIHVWEGGVKGEDGKIRGVRRTWKNSKPVSETVLGEYLSTRTFESTRGAAKTWVEQEPGEHSFEGLPIVEVYANRKSDMMSEPPLMELAWTNLEHWQSSSDQKNILRFARLAQKVVSGAKINTEETDEPNMKAAVDNTMLLTDPNAKAYYLEHTGAGIKAGSDDIKAIEEKAKAQGARPTQERTINSTATGAMIDLINVSSDAQAWVQETAIALRQGFQIAAKWRGLEIDDEFGIELNADFAQKITAEDFKYLENARMRGDLPIAEFLQEMQRRGILSESIELKALVEAIAAEMGSIPDDEDGDE